MHLKLLEVVRWAARKPLPELKGKQMKKILSVLGIVGACALCCAIPLAIPLLGAAVASGAGLALGWDVALCGAILVVGAAGVMLWYRRAEKAKAAGCGPACGADGKQCGS